jgi:hypothetical protein
MPPAPSDLGKEAFAMRVTKIRITERAARHMARHDLDVGDLAVVLRFGRLERQAGVELYILGERDVPKGAEKGFARLVGVVAIVERGELITIDRNRAAVAA